MPTDRIVTARHLLRAVTEYERRGSRKLLSELESLEADLAEFLMEDLTRLYHLLLDMGLSGREARRAHRLAEKTTLVCLTALRAAHRQLWEPQAEPPSEPPPHPGDDPPPLS